MEFLILLSCICTITSLIFLSKSPYVLIAGVMSVAFFVRFSLGVLYSRFIGFLVLLVYLGGIQVLFLYALRIVPEETKFSPYKYSALGFLFLAFNGGFFIYDYFLEIPLHELRMRYIGSISQFRMFISMVIMLLFTILVSANLCKKHRIPLRKRRSPKKK